MLTPQLILEIMGFAWRALKSNLLRTIRSLLGGTIGIFSIISSAIGLMVRIEPAAVASQSEPVLVVRGN